MSKGRGSILRDSWTLCTSLTLSGHSVLYKLVPLAPAVSPSLVQQSISTHPSIPSPSPELLSSFPSPWQRAWVFSHLCSQPAAAFPLGQLANGRVIPVWLALCIPVNWMLWKSQDRSFLLYTPTPLQRSQRRQCTLMAGVWTAAGLCGVNSAFTAYQRWPRAGFLPSVCHGFFIFKTELLMVVTPPGCNKD